MSALVRYWIAVAVRSQRFFAPVLLFLAGIMALTTGQSGPLSDCYGTATGILFVSSLWLTVGVLHAEQRDQAAVTAANAGSTVRPLVAGMLALLAFGAGLLAVGLVVPIVDGSHHVTAAAVAAGALSQISGALFGVAVGVLCSRLVLPRTAASVVAAFLIGFAVLRFWFSPLHEVLHLNALNERPSDMLAPLVGLAMASFAIAAASAAATHLLARRRA